MKSINRNCIILTGFLFMLSIAACKKENEENLINKQGGASLCDTINMKYSTNILPVIQANCYSCHGNGQTEGGINLEGYNNLKIQVNNNHLLNVIKHAPGFTPMPQGLPKLSACDISKIEAWINSGANDN
jgi:cytochrome c553